jgi:hypothetical protein
VPAPVNRESKVGDCFGLGWALEHRINIFDVHFPVKNPDLKK